jgi:hypothetical protein
MTRSCPYSACLVLGALLALPACASNDAPEAYSWLLSASVGSSDHDFFSTVSIDDKDTLALPSLGDLWVTCWSDDDAVYTTSGDGTGFGATVAEIVVSRLDGRPGDERDALRGTTIATGFGQTWSGVAYTRKPTGMLCANGELYVAVQDLRAVTFSDAPAATILRSIDKGRTWSWDTRGPMFTDATFTTIMFADLGKDSEHAKDGFAYAYALDGNWSGTYSSGTPPTRLYLARVPLDGVQNRARWEFFSGLDEAGAPRWSSEILKRAAVLEDTRHLYEHPFDPGLAHQNMTTLSQGSIVYDAPLQRYIYASWTAYTYELYEAPEPWGPWTHFYAKDFGAFPWTEDSAGGYGTNMSSKFISADGQSMWMSSTVWEAGVVHYQYSLREVRVTAYAPSDATNAPSADVLSKPEQGAVLIQRSAHSGHPEYLNDGVVARQSNQSWTGESSDEDYWGYMWPKALHVNTVRYTTGDGSARGGWFEDLTVQVRSGKSWVAVEGLTLSPDYACDASVLGNRTFTLKFHDTVTDGVRIFGRPGGSESFTSAAELSVTYE